MARYAIASSTFVAGNFLKGNSWKGLNFCGWYTSAALGAIGDGKLRDTPLEGKYYLIERDFHKIFGPFNLGEATEFIVKNNIDIEMQLRNRNERLLKMANHFQILRMYVGAG